MSSQSFHQDLSLPRLSQSSTSRPSPPSRYFTAMESQNSTKNSQQHAPPPIRSTITKVRELYLAENADGGNGVGKKKMSTASQCVPTARFGCATLPTKLKQTASFNGKLSSRASAPQMNSKFTLYCTGWLVFY